MKLLEHTTTAWLLPRLSCRDQTAAVREMVAALAASGMVRDPEQLLRELIAREQDASTAVGHGIAIPHARSSQVVRLCLAAATLAKPLPVAGDDGQPIDVLFLLVGADGQSVALLRVLARLARMVKHDTFLAALRGAATPQQMRQALADHDDRHV